MPHVSEQSKRAAEDAQLRPTDVVVVTFPKTGTTWLQQICEQLRTGGDMRFSEITERQPWLDFAWDCGQDLGADQVASPRLFKSHQLLSAINPGARYLSIVREPASVLLSWFAFQKGKKRPVFVDCADANAYAATGHFEGSSIFGTNLWDYYVELWEARLEPNVLVLCYEELARAREEHLPAIASFLGVRASAELLQTVMEMSSKEFMLEKQSHFDDHFIAEKGRELERAAKVMEPGVKVTSGHETVLSEETRAWLQRLWDERVLPRTGLTSYRAMAAALRSRGGAGQ